jgi:NAD(P)-dependent dehydrogenase (short-subunit alcohol dehydrogenase family)
MRLESARRQVEEAGGQALIISADVVDPQAIARAAERIFDEWGRLV